MYLITSNAISLVQAVALKNDGVRQYLDLPPPPKPQAPSQTAGGQINSPFSVSQVRIELENDSVLLNA